VSNSANKEHIVKVISEERQRMAAEKAEKQLDADAVKGWTVQE
jgi:hypothetical protein